MFSFARSHLGGVTAALWIAASAAGVSAEAPDPLVRRVPAERPPLREVVTGADFEARYAAAREKLGDWSKWEDSKAPVVGLRVIAVFPGAQVAGAIDAGDVLVRMGGVRLCGDGFPDSDEPRDVEYYSAKANAVKTLRLRPGKLGVQPGVYWRPELAYLRSRHRDPRWDDLVLTAIAARGGDPDLAETALARAVRAGRPHDEVTDQVAAEVSLLRNRPEAASDFAWFAEQAAGPGAEAVSPLLLLRVAIANYQLKEVLRLVRREPRAFEELDAEAVRQLVVRHESGPEAVRELSPPSALAEGRYRDPLLPRLVAGDRATATRALASLRAGGPLALEATTGHFQVRAFEPGEPAPDFDLTVEVSATPDGTGLDHYLRDFVVSLVTVVYPESAAVDPLYRPEGAGVAFSEFGDVRLAFGNTQARLTFVDPTAAGLSGAPQRVRLVRVGDRAEVFLNGHRVYYGPAPASPSPEQFVFKVTGSRAKVAVIEAVELVARP